ncbi:hypothetical protein M0802_012312 [Mischocyttarus mexicanus]|nr:hypothetical protein M0802_012312 [Mischocyttarus mexicanus]
MRRLKFMFSVNENAEKPKSNVIVVTLITTQDNKSYIVPEQYQLMQHHTELASTTAYK